MSFYNGSNSPNNSLAFPSYNQQNLQQGNNTGLSSTNGSVGQLQNQYSESSLIAPLHQGENQSHSRADGYINSENGVGGVQGALRNNARPEQLHVPKLREDDVLKKVLMKKDRVNRPGQKFGAKKRLWVWSWFVQDLNDQNIAVCDFCGKIITRVASDRGLPKKLVEHLHTHKLTKDLINTSRPIRMDGDGSPYMNNLQVSYAGPFSQQSNNGRHNNITPTNSQHRVGISSPSLHLQQNGSQHKEIISLLSQIQTSNHSQRQTGTESIAPELQQNGLKHRRTNTMNAFLSDTHQLHPQSQVYPSQHHVTKPNSSAQYNRRYISSNFENSPYSGPKFHRHLLKFLAEHKLPIRILKLHSFQQLIYDLRPDSITDLLDLTGLYTSFVEVARAENITEALNINEASNTETSVVNTLAREMGKK